MFKLQRLHKKIFFIIIFFCILIVIFKVDFISHKLHINNKFDFISENLNSFKIAHINTSGLKTISQNEIQPYVDILYNKNILFVNPWSIKRQFLNLEMIDEIKVTKQYPDTLSIEINEKIPMMLLLDDGEYYIIDNKKRINKISKKIINDNTYLKNLTYVEGAGTFNEIKNNINYFIDQEINLSRISGIYRVNNRRWDLVIDKKIKIMLSDKIDKNLIKNILTLIDSLRSNGGIHGDALYSTIDLRVKGKVFIKNITDND